MNYLIVGAATGIGKAVAQQLLAKNHTVFGTFHTTEIDYSGLAAVEKFDAVADDFPTDWLPEQLDGLVFCPGSILLKPFARISPTDFENDFKLQVGGAIKSIQKCLPRLKNSAAASIVLFSTVAVERGFNFHTLVSTSKGAVQGLTRALAAEFAPNLRVNCIAPSVTDTPLAKNLVGTDEKKAANAQRHPLKKIGQPEDLANAVEFLLSEKSGWITGQILHVDGGISVLNTN